MITKTTAAIATIAATLGIMIGMTTVPYTQTAFAEADGEHANLVALAANTNQDYRILQRILHCPAMCDR